MSNSFWHNANAIRYSSIKLNDLPNSIPDWVIDSSQSALLVHDMQCYFLDRFQVGAEPVESLRKNVARLVEISRRCGVPVIYTAQPGGMTKEQRGLLRDFWGEGMKATPEQRSIASEIAPRPVDIVLDKWRYSAFVRTGLDRQLANRGVRQLILCGIYAHVGVLASALDAYGRDIETFVVGDATADFDRERHLHALQHLARTCARVLHTDQAIREIEE